VKKQTISRIHAAIDNLFERIKARFLGVRLVDKTLTVTADRPDLTLAGLATAAAADDGAKISPKTIMGIVNIAGSYLDSARERAKAEVVHHVLAAQQEGKPPAEVLSSKLTDVWGKVTSDVLRIADTETQRSRATGALEGITMLNLQAGINDPTVFFVVVRDGHRCGECTRLHLMADGLTPRVWKMSEVGTGYHKKGQPNPKVNGLHPHCFTGSMRLHTDRGAVRFDRAVGPQNVVVDARVKIRRVGNNQYGAEIPGAVWLDRHAAGSTLRAATAVYDTGVRDCIRFTLESGQVLEVSEEHEMWIDDDNTGKKIPASQVVVGDKVPLISGSGCGVDSWPELAELAGNMMGDGFLCGEEAGWYFFGHDLPYGQKLLDLANSFLGRRPRLLRTVSPDKKYAVERASFKSKVIGRLLRQLGFDKKPRQVPDSLFAADETTIRAFLRGLFAADGHSEKGPCVVLAQNDLDFLREIQILLSMVGFTGRIFSHGAGGDKEIQYANGDVFGTTRKPCWRLCIGGKHQCERFLSEIGMGVPYKQQALSERVSAASASVHGAWRTARVSLIEKIGPQQTYCLTEPHTNTVTVNGIVTGQCRCSLATLMPGYGFDGSGQVKYIGRDHDEYARQRG
jgi:hypothetical protein